LFVKRVITAVIGLPIAILLISLGHIPLLAMLMLISLIGLYEFYKAASDKSIPVHKAGYVFVFVYYYILQNPNNLHYLLLTLSALMLTILIMLVVFYKIISFIDCAITLFGFYYIPVLFSFIYLAREHYLGSFFIWIIFICAWGSDTGAYIFGRLFGRHKLAPVLSPKKTVEGALGGILSSGLIAFIYATLMLRFSNVYVDESIPIVLICIVAGVAGSVFAQLGDLAASAIKRQSNIKDYGNIFPGHGGVMDRFDSVLFTAPSVYILIVFLV